jgi:hypothetical protein
MAAPAFTPADMADLMTSGHAGMPLEKMLHAYFPDAGRADVYAACGLAAAIWAADAAVVDLENRMLRRHGGRLPGEAA